MTSKIIRGDCLEVLPTLDAGSIDSCVTDPPYHLQSINKRFAKVGRDDKTWSSSGPHQRTASGFMNKAWDGGDIAFRPETWELVYRVLKPGAHLAAFGGTRTFHRMMVAIEDAGFDLRHTLMWCYGTGFPKSHNQHGEWEGWGTALKPAWEPIALFRKPLVGTVDANLAAHRTGALNIDGCRIETDEVLAGGAEKLWSHYRDDKEPVRGRPLREARRNQASDDARNTFGKGLAGSKAVGETDLGRWPANLLHDGSDEVVRAFPDSDGQQGDLGATGRNRPTKTCFGDMGPPLPHMARNDAGSAARFFYCAKASRADRNDGLDGFEERPLLWNSGAQSPGTFQADGTKKAAQNNHPTVKPTTLMQWLCRLITPPGGLVLDPFAGSGSTGRGALLEGFSFVGIESDVDYAAIAKRRIEGASPLFAQVEAVST